VRPSGSLAALALAGMIGACEPSESLGVYSDHSGPGMSAGATASSAAQTTETNTTETNTTDDATEADIDTSTEASTETSSASHCAPEPDDDDCRGCVKSACCEPLAACEQDPLCVCMKSCVEGGSGPQLCLSLCMPGAVYSGFIACVALNCAPQCAP